MDAPACPTPIEKFTVHLAGRLTLPTPLSVIRPGEGRVPRTKLIVGSVAYDVPVIHGETLKGRLRRVGVDLLLEAITGHPDFARRHPGRHSPFDLDDYYYLALGGVKGAGEESPRDILRNDEMRRRNPLVSLFGAATPWIAGRLSVESAIPDEPVLSADTAEPVLDVVSAGVRQDDLKVRPEIAGLFGADQLERWVAQSETTRAHSQAKRTVEGLDKKLRLARRMGASEALTLEREATAARRGLAELEERDVFKQAVSRPLPGYAAIPKGFSAPHRFTLDNVSLTELGLFLAILGRFATNPQIGGHRSVGCGRIDAEYSVLVRPPRLSRVEPAGALRIDSDRYELRWTRRDETAALALVDAAEAAWAAAATDILDPARFDFRAPRLD